MSNPNKLTRLKIREVSSVDRGAGVGVKVKMLKRDAPSLAALLKTAMSFTDAQEQQEASEATWALCSELNEMSNALTSSVQSILADESVTDKVAAINASLTEFKAAIAELSADDVVADDDPDASGNTTLTKGDQMSDDLKKALEAKDAEIATLAKSIEEMKKAADTHAAELELAKANLSKDDTAYMDGLDETAKAKFKGMSRDERDAEMKGKAMKKALLPDDLRKELDDAAEFRKSFLADVEKRELADFAKRATDLGQPAEFGATLRTISKADPKAAEAVEGVIKALIEQAKTGKLFSEFGKNGGPNGGNGNSAYDQLVAKAGELRKADPKLTAEQAFDKAYTDPSNASIVALHKSERNSNQVAA